VVVPNEGSGPGRFVYSQSTVTSDLTGYKIIFSNGKEVIAPAGGVITVKAPPGNYTITVKGMGPKPSAYTDPSWPGTVVWARGTSEVQLRPGAAATVAVDMYPAAEPTTWAQLADAIQAGGLREEFIYIEGTINDRGSGTISVSRPITLKGSEEIHTNGAPGSLFNVTGSNLIIDGPTLRGHGGNSAPLVTVTGGLLTLTNGAITGNTNPSGSGGGVSIGTGGNFAMDGGTVSWNTANQGGGVHIGAGGTFTMTGGTISGNTLTGTSSGGGVYVANNAAFTMVDGTITGNSAGIASGGGVYIVGPNGTFDLNPPATTGSIFGNTASSGPQVRNNTGTFEVNGVAGTDY
jgi:hypothetical protein